MGNNVAPLLLRTNRLVKRIEQKIPVFKLCQNLKYEPRTYYLPSPMTYILMTKFSYADVLTWEILQAW